MDYKDIVFDGDKYRKDYIDGINEFILRKNKEGFDLRESFMKSEDFPEKIEAYRKQYIEMLGIDKFDSTALPEPTMTLVGKDEECSFYRVVVFVTKEVPFHGLLMIPNGIKKAPLIAVLFYQNNFSLIWDRRSRASFNVSSTLAKCRRTILFTPSLKKELPGTAPTPTLRASSSQNSTSV